MANIVKSDKYERNSKEIVESYIFSTVRGTFGIYSERLLLRLVELAQKEVYGLDFKSGKDLGQVTVGEWGRTNIIIPVKDILSGEDDTNYSKAKTAVKNLMGKFLEYEDDNHYVATSILNMVDVDKVAGQMIIQVNDAIWKAMLDFSKGYRKYELEIATKLRGKYSLRIYKLVSRQNNPITFTIEALRKMWGLTDKYARVDDFVKNTIVSAKEELDKVSPYSFEYTLNYPKGEDMKRGKRGRVAPSSITFHPMRMVMNTNADSIRKEIAPSMLIGRDVRDLLINKFGFDDLGIKANITLLEYAVKNFDLFDFLQELASRALRADNPQGYVVNAIRKHLKDDYGILIEKGMVIHSDYMIAEKPKIADNAPIKEILKIIEK